MIEHRAIGRMVKALEAELAHIERTDLVDVAFLGQAVTFIKGFADECHHGKEEDILFSDLRGKNPPEHLARILDELIAEHRTGRATVVGLGEAVAQYADGHLAAREDILSALRIISKFYPAHITKEDKHFFLPVMQLFSQAERDDMLARGHEFDSRLLHANYLRIIERVERRNH
jgi:hemerythrin-like domain-containing protein